jgi:hypothetical protein
VLDSDDVRSKVAKDAREEWPKLCRLAAEVADAMRTLKPFDAVDLAIEGWYGDYLKGAYANYTSRLDDLRSLIGFAGRFEDMQEMLAQIMLLNSETSDRRSIPTPTPSGSRPSTRPRAWNTPRFSSSAWPRDVSPAPRHRGGRHRGGAPALLRGGDPRARRANRSPSWLTG